MSFLPSLPTNLAPLWNSFTSRSISKDRSHTTKWTTIAKSYSITRESVSGHKGDASIVARVPVELLIHIFEFSLLLQENTNVNTLQIAPHLQKDLRQNPRALPVHKFLAMRVYNCFSSFRKLVDVS